MVKPQSLRVRRDRYKRSLQDRKRHPRHQSTNQLSFCFENRTLNQSHEFDCLAFPEFAQNHRHRNRTPDSKEDYAARDPLPQLRTLCSNSPCNGEWSAYPAIAFIDIETLLDARAGGCDLGVDLLARLSFGFLHEARRIAEGGRRLKEELNAANAAMFDVRCLMFDVNASKAARCGVRNAEWQGKIIRKGEVI
jgi:hypothetical protein